jgi:hypothetical protein
VADEVLQAVLRIILRRREARLQHGLLDVRGPTGDVGPAFDAQASPARRQEFAA